jgi:hypothetical protein
MMLAMTRYPLRQLALLLSLCSILGCGNSRPKTIPVRGKVTLNGGKWPGRGSIAFRAVKAADGHIMRPGRAYFEEDGAFVAGTYDPNDGLIPGEYDIIVLYQKQKSPDSNDVQAGDAIVGHDKLTIPADAVEPVEYQFDVRH